MVGSGRLAAEQRAAGSDRRRRPAPWRPAGGGRPRGDAGRQPRQRPAGHRRAGCRGARRADPEPRCAGPRDLRRTRRSPSPRPGWPWRHCSPARRPSGSPSPQADRLRAHLDALRGALDAGDLLKYSALIQRLHELVRDVAAQPVAARPGRAAAGPAGAPPVPAVAAARAAAGQPPRARPPSSRRSSPATPTGPRPPPSRHFRSVIAALSEPTPGGPA